MSRGFERDFLLEISRGNISGMRIMRGLGERESIGTTEQGEDITRMNELSATPAAPASHTFLPWPSSDGEQMRIISESSDDTSSGIGSRTVRMTYLDSTGGEQEEVITMGGTTSILTSATDIRFVQMIHTETIGSNNVSAGNIRIYRSTDATLVYNMIHAGGNMSLVPHRMVPQGKTLHLREWIVGEGNNKRLTMKLRTDCTPEGVRKPGVFLFRSVIIVNGSVGQIPLGYKIPAFSMVKVSAWASAINGEASVHWWGVLVDD